MATSDINMHIAVTHWTWRRVLGTIMVILGLLVLAVTCFYNLGRSAVARDAQRTIDSLQIVLLDKRLTMNENFLNRVAECIAVTTPALDNPESTDGRPNRRR